VALGGSLAVSLLLQYGGFVPDALDISSLDLVTVRFAPGILSITVGLAAGAAAAFGLATKGPTSLIGVMIAAALIPAAATVGIAAAWGYPRIALGSLLLLVVTLILINVAALMVLVALRYRPEQSGWLTAAAPQPRQSVLLLTAVALLAIGGVVVGASVQQIAYEQQVNQEVEDVFAGDEYESVEIVTTRVRYGGISPFQEPQAVTVTLSYTGDGSPPQVGDQLDERLGAAGGQDIRVRVQFVEYQQ
jgi:uncharacterized membrane protein